MTRPFPLTPDEDAVRIANRMTVSKSDGWLECTVCEGKRFWDLESAHNHINGERHKRHLMNAEWKEFTSNPDNGTFGNPELGIPPEIECRGDAWFKCTVCSLGGEFWDPKQVMLHVNGRNHKSRMNQQKPEPVEKPLAPVTAFPKQFVNRFILPPPSYVPSSDPQSPENAPSPDSQSSLKNESDLPPGFSYNENFQSSHSRQAAIQCDVCGGKLFSSPVDAWRHSLLDSGHLYSLQRRVDFLFLNRTTLPRNEVLCEPCGEVILDRGHFHSPSHMKFAELMRKFDFDFFQPFLAPDDRIRFFSWRRGSIMNNRNMPPESVIFNNPQLLIHQWVIVKNSMPPTSNWLVSECTLEALQEVLEDIPRSQRI